jgi:hypothetical protein
MSEFSEFLVKKNLDIVELLHGSEDRTHCDAAQAGGIVTRKTRGCW